MLRLIIRVQLRVKEEEELLDLEDLDLPSLSSETRVTRKTLMDLMDFNPRGAFAKTSSTTDNTDKNKEELTAGLEFHRVTLSFWVKITDSFTSVGKIERAETGKLLLSLLLLLLLQYTGYSFHHYY